MDDGREVKHWRKFLIEKLAETYAELERGRPPPSDPRPKEGRLDAALAFVPEPDDPDYLVYVIGDGGDTVKIGITSRPRDRLQNIVVNSGRPKLRYLFQSKRFPEMSARRIERAALQQLRKEGRWTVTGEWVNCPPEVAIDAVQKATTLLAV